MRPLVLFALALILSSPAVGAGLDARLARFPDVSASHVVFTYAGDVWIAPKTGGDARRLSTPAGNETFARFSPDGALVAFGAKYDGNDDVWVMPVAGGVPRRLTSHPGHDRVVDWYPDGSAVLVASDRWSEMNRYDQFWRVPLDGGPPERLPLAHAADGSIAADGKTLAFIQLSTDDATWKRYRGGSAPDIWLFDLEDLSSQQLTVDPAADTRPQWHGDDLYFLSDRGAEKRRNIWAWNRATGAVRQLTRFTDHDCHSPSIGPADLVFENGGQLWLLDLTTGATSVINIQVTTDRATLLPQSKDVSELISSVSLSPSGARAVVAARGEIFTLPREHGPVRHLTRTSGVAERHPAWSPQGDRIAVFSDRTGEYELTLLPADGVGESRTVTSLGPGFRYQPFWSPDGKRIAFVDQAMRLQVASVATGRVTEIDRGRSLFEGLLRGYRFGWSPDSRWLAYYRSVDTEHRALFVHDFRSGETHQLTSGFHDDHHPVFDPKGRWLYWLSNRTFHAVYGDVDNTWVYPNSTVVMAAPLTDLQASPLAPRSDEESAAEGDRPSRKKKRSSRKKTERDDDENERPPVVRIDRASFEARAVALPLPAGNYRGLAANDTHVLVVRTPRAGAGDEAKATLIGWNLEEREEKTFADDVSGYELSQDGKALLVGRKGRWFVVDAEPGVELEDALPTGDLRATIDPAAEWRQLFTDAWRLERDYFYDPNMHGVDWPLMRERYGRLLDGAVTRWDVNVVLGELIGELCSSHAYRWGGDTEQARTQSYGWLGADLIEEAGSLRIARILRAAPWDIEARSALAEPGVSIDEGEYVVAVNGTPLADLASPWEAFSGLGGEVAAITVNAAPTLEGSRQVLLTLLESEGLLRYRAWVESNRARVDEASGGRIGYVHVPDTGVRGQDELVRQLQGQVAKEGLVVDERFNAGGQIPDRFIELINRPVDNYWAVRDGRDWQWPPFTHVGPKAMVINQWSGSGGDAFPLYFRDAGLGPLVGARTWGGLIGISGSPDLVDGGGVTVPTFAIYSPDGEWIVENHGVEPDYPVPADPAVMATGVDPQLEKAIELVLQALAQDPPRRPARPAYVTR